MKIATWNVERLKHLPQIEQIKKICADLDVDVLVLTETDVRLHLCSYNSCETEELPEHCEVALGKYIDYQSTERRVVIYTKYPCVRKLATSDALTSTAMEVKTPMGNVVIFGVIIGILGNREDNFEKDLNNAIQDIKRFSKIASVIVCGDFNCSFADGYYFTKHGRKQLLKTFDECDIEIATARAAECIDHIAVSNNLIDKKDVQIEEWNQDKKLSDHKGIMIEI